MSNTTISDFQFDGTWPSNWGTSAVLGILAEDTFVDEDGKVWPVGVPDAGLNSNFVTTSTITVIGGTATAGNFSIPKTENANPATVRYTIAIFRTNGSFLAVLYSGWHLRASLGNTITFRAWQNDQGQIFPQPDGAASITQVNVAVAAGLNNPASTTQLGLVKVSSTPSDTANPIVLEFHDRRVGNFYNVKSAAIGAHGDGSTDDRTILNTLLNTTLATTGGVVLFPHDSGSANTDYLIGSNITFPANVQIVREVGARIKVATGVTVTWLADGLEGPYQFFNLQGTGVVSFAGNTLIRELGGKWWGAVGDGSTNDRTPIQQAVTAASTLGTARIFFPAGIYLITGTPTGTASHKALILLPTIAFAGNELQEIWIDGPSLPPAVFGTVVTTNQPSTKACIFKTTVNTDAVFGGSNGTDFTAVGLKMTNCIVRIPDNPSVIGIDGRLLGGFFLDWVGVDTGRYTTSVVQPTDTNQAGIITPQILNNADQTLGHVFVTGSYYGVSVNEHTSGDYLILAGNAVGLGFQTADHASYFKRVSVFNNTYNLQFNGVHYTTIEQLNIEHAVTGGGVPVWQGTVYDVNDVSNVGHGEIKAHIVVAGTGVPISWASEFKTNGASGIKERRVGYPDYITRVSLTSAQTLTTAVEAAVSFTTEGEDPYNLHDNSTNPTRITVTRTDTYKISWTVDFAANATGNRTVNFGLNGVTTIPGANFVPVTGIASRSAGCVYYPLTAGDYVDMRVLQTSGGNLDVTQAFFVLERQ